MIKDFFDNQDASNGGIIYPMRVMPVLSKPTSSLQKKKQLLTNNEIYQGATQEETT